MYLFILYRAIVRGLIAFGFISEIVTATGMKSLNDSIIESSPEMYINNIPKFQDNDTNISDISQTNLLVTNTSEEINTEFGIYSRQLPPKVVGGAIGGGLGGGIGGAIGGGVGYLVAGPIGGGVGGAAGGDRKSRQGVGGAIGGKIGGGNGAAIGAGVGGAIGGGIGGFLAGPFGGGLGGLLGGGTGGAFGAAYIPDMVQTHEEDVPGFPKRNITVPIPPPEDEHADKLPFESRTNFTERLRQRISGLRLRFSNIIKNGK